MAKGGSWSVNPHGNHTHSSWYYLRSGALASLAPKLRKDFRHHTSPQPIATDSQEAAPTPQVKADSSHAPKPDSLPRKLRRFPSPGMAKRGIFKPGNNACTQEISNVIKLMLNESWIMYSEIPADVKKRWRSLHGSKKRNGISRRPMTTRRGGATNRSCRISGLTVNKVNRASSKGNYLYNGGSTMIPKTRARMTRSLDCPPTKAELFRETHTRKCDKHIVEKRADYLLTEFSANFKQATQRAQEEGDESAGTVDPNVVWHQTLSEPYKNWVYGAEGFFAPPAMEVPLPLQPSLRQALLRRLRLDLRDHVQNLTQSLENQGQVLQQHIYEVWRLNDTLAQNAWAEEHLRRMEEMQRQMATFYNPLRPGNSTLGGSGPSTTPPLPRRPSLQQPDHPPIDDDDDYEDA
ncbi:hypothetical protein PIB30_056881 [Stylosanthes scabra]|uniref:Uncharacterized protein n=1 Tax=Stylosanthes scabra TaxID=79078 RepID=A0ABU6VKL0_9FABA|nr:hypothetical protein [Stylosanthes scabra]